MGRVPGLSIHFAVVRGSAGRRTLECLHDYREDNIGLGAEAVRQEIWPRCTRVLGSGSNAVYVVGVGPSIRKSG